MVSEGHKELSQRVGVVRSLSKNFTNAGKLWNDGVYGHCVSSHHQGVMYWGAVVKKWMSRKSKIVGIEGGNSMKVRIAKNVDFVEDIKWKSRDCKNGGGKWLGWTDLVTFFCLGRL